MRAGQQLGPQLFHLPYGHLGAPLDAEADVGPATGQGERPGVAGKDVRFEPHPQVDGGRSHVREVLAEGVPLAQIAGVMGAEFVMQSRNWGSSSRPGSWASRW